MRKDFLYQTRFFAEAVSSRPIAKVRTSDIDVSHHEAETVWRTRATLAVGDLQSAYSNVIDEQGVLELLRDLKRLLLYRLRAHDPVFSVEAFHAFDEDAKRLSTYVRLLIAVNADTSHEKILDASEAADDLIADCVSEAARASVVAVFDRR